MDISNMKTTDKYPVYYLKGFITFSENAKKQFNETKSNALNNKTYSTEIHLEIYGILRTDLSWIYFTVITSHCSFAIEKKHFLNALPI